MKNWNRRSPTQKIIEEEEMLDAISRFVQASPMSVIVRGLMERVDPRHRHVSTARLLAQAKNSP